MPGGGSSAIQSLAYVTCLFIKTIKILNVTKEGDDPAVAGGTEDPEGAFTSVDPWSAAPGPTAGAGKKRRRFATSTTKA
jgi:hypothetical protein